MSTAKSCFQCGKKGATMYDYVICDPCKSKLGLFTDKTINKYISLFEKSEECHSYKEEIRDRLINFEKDYIKKRIKLLYIQERVECLEKNKLA